jgi:hypothetical protein
MSIILWPLVAFFPFFLLLVLHGRRGRPCPGCGGPLSGLQSPLTETRRQWIEGGYLCRRCDCESDLRGSRVGAGGYNRRAFVRVVALLAATAVTGAALIALLLRSHS